MNTFSQDEIIPIYITLQYANFFMKFPINPEELKIERPSEGSSIEVSGVGEVNVLKKPKLASLTIESFFWHQNNLVPGRLYTNWLDIWQKSKKPARLIITGLNIFMEVTCEHFTPSYKAGEESDIYFSLSMKEYKPYGAKFLNSKTKTNTFDFVKNISSLTSPVLVEIPRPGRSDLKKGLISSIYTITVGDTLVGIAKKITGETKRWKEFYEENKNEIGNMFANDGLLSVGAQMIVPQKWTSEFGDVNV